MSYEPTLIISKEDLHRYEDNIMDGFTRNAPVKESEKHKQERFARICLDDAMLEEGFAIKSVSLVRIWPEGTTHNAAVRKLLHELNIEFAVDN